MSTNVLFLKFVKTLGEDDEAFENRIQLYKSPPFKFFNKFWVIIMIIHK